MESLNYTDIQAEKANVMLKHRKLQKIGSLFRLIEVCVVLVFISRLRLPMQLPFSFKNSSEYFREFLVFMSSPGFIFLIGNAIIIALFAQSGKFSAHGSKKNNSEYGNHHDFVQNNIKNEKVQSEKQNIGTEDSIDSEKQSFKTEDRIQSEKQSIEIEDAVKNSRINGRKGIQASVCEELVRISTPEDDMSNEEFRRTIEAFIAKQQRLLREEGYSLN